MPLRELEVRNAKPKDKVYKLADGDGLHLVVHPNGSKYWQQRCRFRKKEKVISHGKYPLVGIAEARQKRDKAKKQLAGGKDPVFEKRLARIHAETKARCTFILVAEEYLDMLLDRELAEQTMKKKYWHIETLAKPLHQRPIDEITSAELLHLLKGIERSGRRETAKKLRGTLSAVFRLAVVTLRAESDPTEAIKGALLPPKVTSRAAITDEKKFGALLRDLDAFSGWRVIADALKFQILTMARPGEVRGAKKQEFDLQRQTWTVPAERMKMRRDHIVPLSVQALEIVDDNWPAYDEVELIFPSLVSNRKWLSENAFNSMMRRMGYSKEEVTAHGFRATASTILNNRGFDGEVIEAALAHQDTNAVRRTYNRATYFDQRVKLMQDWANLIDNFRVDFPPKSQNGPLPRISHPN